MKKKSIVVPLTALLLIGGGIAGVRLLFSEEKEAVWKTVAAAQTTVEKVVTATGRVVPLEQVEVGTEVSGTIQKLYTTYNSTVKKGQLLAQIDKSKILTQIAQQQAAVDAARNEFSYREKQYNRTRALTESGATGAQELETAEYQLESARTSLIRAQALLDQAKVDLRNTAITSPMDGVVLNCAVEEGQTVAASLSAPTLFVIARNLEKMKVETDIDEADVGVVKEGQPIRFRVDAFPDRRFQGVLTQVRLNPNNNSGVITYTVIIEADNPEGLLLPGMTANVDIVVETAEDVIAVPIAAQRFAVKAIREKGEHLFVLKGEMPTSVVVRTGTNNGNLVAVLEGLQEGDQVIVGEERNGVSRGGRGGNSSSGSNNPFMPQPPGRRR